MLQIDAEIRLFRNANSLCSRIHNIEKLKFFEIINFNFSHNRFTLIRTVQNWRQIGNFAARGKIEENVVIVRRV